MRDGIPTLEIGRDGEIQREVELSANVFTVGRGSSTYTPEVELDDPESWISRRHCILTQEWGSWWVEDCGSRNGTFLRRDGELRRLTEKLQLSTGDVVCITADADESGPNSTWELRVIDPSSTQTLDSSPTAGHRPAEQVRPSVYWDGAAMRLEVIGDGEPRVVELRKQGYALVAHMAERNAANDGEPVVCTVDELLEAVWGGPDQWDRYRPPTTDNLRDVVLAVRRAVEPDSSNPVIVVNQRGVGYKLHTASR